MDTTTLIIVAGATLIFFGLLIWKGFWLIRKIGQSPDPESEAKSQGNTESEKGNSAGEGDGGAKEHWARSDDQGS
ncbi:MAG: hypothetical protein V2I82_08610 [Halieaceae bacterium]|jgi:hypothetical protein|nr:hypothetical protein [Halieaceae bacterium]